VRELAICGEDACHRFLGACFRGIDTRHPKHPAIYAHQAYSPSFYVLELVTRAAGSRSATVKHDGIDRKSLSNQVSSRCL